MGTMGCGLMQRLKKQLLLGATFMKRELGEKNNKNQKERPLLLSYPPTQIDPIKIFVVSCSNYLPLHIKARN